MMRAKKYTTIWEAPLAFFGGHKTGPNLVSLPVPTYGGAIGFHRSVFCKQEMDYIIHEVRLLGSSGTHPFTVSELSSFPKGQFFTDSFRTVRTYVLRVDVVLAVTASIVALPSADPQDTLVKYDQMFTRRVNKGQFHGSAPTFGPKEYLIESYRFAEPNEVLEPLDVSEDFGIQPYAQDYSDPKKPWYYAPMRMEHGVVRYPTWDEVKAFGLCRYNVGAV